MLRMVRVCNVVPFLCVALFLITLFELNLGLYSLHLHSNTKETFSSTLKLLSNAFCAYIM